MRFLSEAGWRQASSHSEHRSQKGLAPRSSVVHPIPAGHNSDIEDNHTLQIRRRRLRCHTWSENRRHRVLHQLAFSSCPPEGKGNASRNAESSASYEYSSCSKSSASDSRQRQHAKPESMRKQG